MPNCQIFHYLDFLGYLAGWGATEDGGGTNKLKYVSEVKSIIYSGD
jgi:hypothetical protein